MRRLLRWFFCDPETGRVVIAQRPNPPLVVFLAATAVRIALDPQGTVGSAVRAVAIVAIVWWSVDEILRGTTPFRRVLGVTVLAATLLA